MESSRFVVALDPSAKTLCREDGNSKFALPSPNGLRCEQEFDRKEPVYSMNWITLSLVKSACWMLFCQLFPPSSFHYRIYFK